MKQDGSAVRVLIVEGGGLGGAAVEGILDPNPAPVVVRAESVSQARELLRAGEFDMIVADGTRLRGVLDALFAFVGLFSPEGVVLDANEAPLAAGGLARGDVVGHRFVDLPWFAHSELERARVSEAIARAAAGEAQRFETSVLSRQGGIVCIDASFAPLRDRAGAVTHVVGSGIDVTVRRKAERELARSQTRLAEAQRVAHVGSWEWDVARNSVTWSEEMYRIYGVERDKHAPTYETFLASVHEEDRAHTRAVLAKALENVSPFVYDHRILRPDGAVRMLHTRGEVMADGEGNAARLVGSCWDITERWEAMRRAQKGQEDLRAQAEQLRALSARLSEVREEERREISRELHDQVGQALTALKLDLGWLRGQLGAGASPAALARIAGMEEVLDATLETTRRISSELRPAILDDLGLPATLRWQAREFSHRTGIACEVRASNEGATLEPVVALTLFRVVQEALTNVARHAEARHVVVELRAGETTVLTISDDGKGIPPGVVDRATSLGLVGMRERALAIGGSIELGAGPGGGTTVTVRVTHAGKGPS